MGAIAHIDGFATGDSSNPTQTSLFQAMSTWVDAQDFESGAFTAAVSYVSASGSVSLSLYTASELDDLGGYGGSVKLLKSFGTISSREMVKVLVDPEAGDWPIERYVFWKAETAGTAGPWQAFFRVSGLFKGGQAALPGAPPDGEVGELVGRDVSSRAALSS